MKHYTVCVLAAWIVLIAAVCHADVKIVTDRTNSPSATSDFTFKTVPQPCRNDVATQATFAIVAGQRDHNGGALDKLHDGKVPTKEDQPTENFFFNAGTEGGRFLIDLKNEIEIKQVNTYSWHAGTRRRRCTALASDGKAAGFKPQPQNDADLSSCGWKLIAEVNTRPQTGASGGQYGVSIQDSTGVLGKYRYLLLDISATQRSDPFGNTFFSEIDVVGAGAEPLVAEPAGQSGAEGGKEIVETGDGKYKITIDTSETPDLTEWVHQELAQVVRSCTRNSLKCCRAKAMTPLRRSAYIPANMRGVAERAFPRPLRADWFRLELQGEAKGAVVHELVHVVQNYGLHGEPTQSQAAHPGGWWRVSRLHPVVSL
jgi:hypothetical protein